MPNVAVSATDSGGGSSAQVGTFRFDRTASPYSYPIVNAPFFNLEIQARTPVKFSWNNGAPDYFTSLSHKRIVEGANTGQINISYVPTKPSGNTVSKDDPNYIEAALNAASGKCRFQYGMTGYQSPYYDALIYDYKASLNEGRLDYSFNIISREISSLNTLIPDSKEINILKDEDRPSNFNSRIALYFRVNYIIEKYLNNEEDTYEFDDGLEDTLGSLSSSEISLKGLRGVQMTEAITRYLDTHHLSLNSDYEFIPGSITVSGHNALEALNVLATSLYNPKDALEHYYMYIDNVVQDNGKKTIRLVRIQSKNKISTVDANTVEYAFDWYHKDSTVISWQPEYKGTALLFREEGDVVEVGLDENGQPNVYSGKVNNAIKAAGGNASKVFTEGSYASYFSTFDIESVQDFTNMQTQKFKRIANYPYDASITVLGTPTNKIYVGSHIIVRPYLQRVLHHSAGEYFVKSITDTVDSNGFRTTMTLTRINTLTDEGTPVKTPLVKIVKPGSLQSQESGVVTVTPRVIRDVNMEIS